MSELIKFSYWFNPYGSYFSTITFWLLLTAFIVSAVAGVYLLIVRDKKTKHNGLLKKTYTICLHWLNSFGFAGLVLFGLRHYRVPYLGMRIWLALWVLICFIWLLTIVKYLIIDVPAKKKKFLEEQELKKYQP